MSEFYNKDAEIPETIIKNSEQEKYVVYIYCPKKISISGKIDEIKYGNIGINGYSDRDSQQRYLIEKIIKYKKIIEKTKELKQFKDDIDVEGIYISDESIESNKYVYKDELYIRIEANKSKIDKDKWEKIIEKLSKYTSSFGIINEKIIKSTSETEIIESESFNNKIKFDIEKKVINDCRATIKRENLNANIEIIFDEEINANRIICTNVPLEKLNFNQMKHGIVIDKDGIIGQRKYEKYHFNIKNDKVTEWHNVFEKNNSFEQQALYNKNHGIQKAVIEIEEDEYEEISDKAYGLFEEHQEIIYIKCSNINKEKLEESDLIESEIDIIKELNNGNYNKIKIRETIGKSYLNNHTENIIITKLLVNDLNEKNKEIIENYLLKNLRRHEKEGKYYSLASRKEIQDIEKPLEKNNISFNINEDYRPTEIDGILYQAIAHKNPDSKIQIKYDKKLRVYRLICQNTPLEKIDFKDIPDEIVIDKDGIIGQRNIVKINKDNNNPFNEQLKRRNVFLSNISFEEKLMDYKEEIKEDEELIKKTEILEEKKEYLETLNDIENSDEKYEVLKEQNELLKKQNKLLEQQYELEREQKEELKRKLNLLFNYLNINDLEEKNKNNSTKK